jgi:hypothetical protein
MQRTSDLLDDKMSLVHVRSHSRLMAKPVLQIQFVSPAPSELMHRALNFIEDVYRMAKEQDIGAVDDIDHYGSGTFVVRVSSARQLGEMRSLVSKLLRQHKLEGDAVVTRQDR